MASLPFAALEIRKFLAQPFKGRLLKRTQKFLAQ